MTLLAAAAALADEVLFPAAAAVEAAGVVPRSHLDRLAEAGLYGLFADDLQQERLADAYRVVEALASGCLATTFVWQQHHSVLRAIAGSALRPTWFEPLRRGQVRAGTAQGGLRPGPPLLQVQSTSDGPVLVGEAPWVTGWGLVDVLLVAARDEDDVANWFLLDAVAAPGLTVSPLDLVAVSASQTVHLRFDRYAVPTGRLVMTLPYEQWPARDAAGLRGNGSLALGVAGRCCQLLREAAGPLAEALDAARSALDEAGPAELPVARAAASELALRCATALVVATGSRAVLAGETAQRLMRECAFLLVFGSRPALRADLLRRVVRGIAAG